MNKKNHKKSKGQNHSASKAEQSRRPAGRVIRVRLVDGIHVCLTALIILAAFAGMVVMQQLGWFETVLGAVLSVLVGGIGAMCIFDMALLLTNCITVADGMVNAGKNAQGDLMIFHTSSIERVELRDMTGRTVSEDREKYTKVALTFVMTSGRINQRPFGRFKQKKLDEIRRTVQGSQAS